MSRKFAGFPTARRRYGTDLGSRGKNEEDKPEGPLTILDTKNLSKRYSGAISSLGQEVLDTNQGAVGQKT